MNDIANRLKELRRIKSIHQTELAGVMGVSKTAVVSYEKGDVIPQADKLIAVAEHYGISMDWLCGIDKPSHTQKWRHELIASAATEGPYNINKNEISFPIYEDEQEYIEKYVRLYKLMREEVIDNELFGDWIVRRRLRYE